MKKTTIAIVSHNLPSEKEPYLHPFIVDHYLTVDRLPTYDPLLVCPAPIGIPGTLKWSRQFGPVLNAPKSRRFSYLSLPKRRGARFVRSQLTRRLLCLLPPPEETIVHLHWLYPVGIVAPLLKKMGYRVVLMVHGGDWRESVDRPDLVELFREALLAADVVLVSGETLGNEIVDVIPEVHVDVMGNYINTELFTCPSAKDVADAQQELGWDPSMRHLLCVANLRPEKGIDLLLDALEKVRNPTLRVHIIGQEADQAYQNLLNERLNRLPHGVVEFHKPVSRQALVQVYHAADGFVLPSRSEGFNVSLLEAAATGLHLIATQTGDAEMVLNECEGSLIPTNDVEKLSQALHTWNSADRRRSPTSATFIQNRFSFDVFRSRLEELYHRLEGHA